MIMSTKQPPPSPLKSQANHILLIYQIRQDVKRRNDFKESWSLPGALSSRFLFLAFIAQCPDFPTAYSTMILALPPLVPVSSSTEKGYYRHRHLIDAAAGDVLKCPWQ